MSSLIELIVVLLLNYVGHVLAFSEQTLILIHAISRHGDRAPVDTYPTDPFIHETFAPYGWGQLTKNGMIHQYELGRFMRKRYSKFLGTSYSTSNVFAQSTDTDRTKMSLQLQMAGLFPPRRNQIWNKNLMWQPIPTNYEPLDDDKLLLGRVPCPRYYELNTKVQKMEADKDDFSLYEYLHEKTQLHFTSPDDVLSLYSTLKAEEEYGLELPSWTNKVYPDTMYKVAAKSFILNAYDQEMRKLKSGLLLKKILHDYHEKINEINHRKIFLYAGHDSTVANFLITLGIWESQVPDYNALIIMELHKMKDNFAIKINFKNNTGIFDLKLPSCGEYCPIYKFTDLVKEVTIENLHAECFNTTWRLKMQDGGSP